MKRLDRVRDRLRAEDPQAGPRIGKYEIVRELGRGGMSVVYQAFDPDLQRTVAVKALKEGNIERLRQEATAAARLRHPNVVAVHEVGPDYIAMEYVEGRTLAQAMPELPLPERVRILETVARTVHHAHEQDVVHRDLKPGNVLIEPNGRVVLTDFGLAKIAGGEGLTLGGGLLGTPQYMAPEQVRGGDAGRAADIWALGVMLYETIAGQRPFEGKTAFETYDLVVRHDPPTLVGGFGAIALKAMQKDPAHRYPTAAAFADDLARALRGEAVSVSRFWLKARQRAMPALAILALAAAAWGLLAQRRNLAAHRDGDSRLQLAVILEKFDREEGRATQALAQDPRNVIYLFDRASTRMLRGMTGRDYGRDPLPDYRAAEADLSQILTLDPASREARFRRGEVRTRIVAFKEMYDQDPRVDCAGAQQDLAAVPDLTPARVWRAIAGYHCGAWRMRNGGDARPELEAGERAVADLTDPPSVWRRGRLRVLLGKLDEAEADFAAAIAAEPGERWAWIWRAIGRKQAGELDRADEYLSHAIEIDHLQSQAFEERGHVRVQLGRYADAAADYRRALAINPGRKTALEPRLAEAERLARR